MKPGLLIALSLEVTEVTDEFRFGIGTFLTFCTLEMMSDRDFSCDDFDLLIIRLLLRMTGALITSLLAFVNLGGMVVLDNVAID